MNEPVLPGLPEPIRNKHGVPLFGSAQVRALQIATWNAARDYFAGLAKSETEISHGVFGAGWVEGARACETLIRQSPDPVEVK